MATHTKIETRDDIRVVEQTNALAHDLYKIMGYRAPPDFYFYMADRSREKMAWEMARKAQVALTATDPNDALDNLGWDRTG